MAFVQANVNYATQYAQDLANAYPYLSHFGAIYGAANSAKYRPVMGKSVSIPSMTVSGALEDFVLVVTCPTISSTLTVQ